MPRTDDDASFRSEFLKHYLAVGIGALGKRDIDALVMHLLDKYGIDGAGPLAKYPNQDVSARLRAPTSKIRQLRYEAGLKYGGRVEDQARARLLVALSRAVLEIDSGNVCLVIEDTLAKNWLQGQLKNHGLIFDHSFNSEILKVDAAGLFKVLGQLFDREQTAGFEAAFKKLAAEKKGEALRAGFARLALSFAGDTAKKAGGALLASYVALLG